MYNVILDCDPGHDDAIALLLACKADNIKMLGVTTVAGNSYIENVTNNAIRVMEYAGIKGIGVYQGCGRPMFNDLYRDTGISIHGADGLGGPEIPKAVGKKQPEHAVEFIVRTLREREEKVTIVAVGPLTNIALALMLCTPEMKAKIDRIVIMGGSVYTEGNVLSAQEFNVYQDPEAARIVMQSGCEIYLNTLDISMKALFMPEDKERLRAIGGKVPTLVAELLDFFGKTHVETFGLEVTPIHDALCTGFLIDPSFIEFQHTYVDISTADKLTRGEIVADIWGLFNKKPNCYISTKVNRERFVDMIIEHMAKYND